MEKQGEKKWEIPLISIYESIRVQKEFDKQAEGSRTTMRNLNEGRQNEIGGIQTLSEWGEFTWKLCDEVKFGSMERSFSRDISRVLN